PVSFTMNLREPLFINRPEIAPPIPGAMVSRAYTDTVTRQRATALAAPSEPRLERDPSGLRNQMLMSREVADKAVEEMEQRVALGGTLAGQSIATAQTSGEQFRYEIAHTVD